MIDIKIFQTKSISEISKRICKDIMVDIWKYMFE